MKKVHIRVLKKQFYLEFAEAFLVNGKNVGPCPFFKEGDSFLYEGSARMPENFCPWAWNDIYKSVSALSNGATYSDWYSKSDRIVDCCTDGIRPVSFLLEAVDDIPVQ
jgi:uncharacterized repeat protein (TIGR04076 family)